MRTPRSRRAFLLIMALILIIILVVMGFGFLGSRVGQYQSTGRAVNAAQARAIARAGIEDARAKLNLDIGFPPPPGAGQPSFTYVEDLQDMSGAAVGFYRVRFDWSKAYEAPYFVLSLTSTGYLGPRTAPVAQHTYRAYIDVSPIKSPKSPTYYQVVRFDDLGELIP